MNYEKNHKKSPKFLTVYFGLIAISLADLKKYPA